MGSPLLLYNHRSQAFLVFVGVSLLFIISQALFFQGFHGDDDLHYTWLAAKMLQGSFSIFVENDIFSGRALLVLLQAGVYAVGGINPFTSNVLTYVAAASTCYLTIFQLMRAFSPRLVLIASALFYFNPVLIHIVVGPSPDILVMLVGVLILLVLQKFETDAGQNQYLLLGSTVGLMSFATLYIKESGLVFIPFVACIMLFRSTKKKLYFLLCVVSAFALGVAVSGWVYYINTGNVFFRMQQLKRATYPNPCLYLAFYTHEMFARLTYLVWEEFIRRLFLAPLLATVAIIWCLFFKTGRHYLREDKLTRYFIVLLIVGLYFPFSITNYQPLCFKTRHFLFILPLSVVVATRWLNEAYTHPPKKWIRNVLSILIIGIGIKWSNNGWNWNFHRCLLAILALFPFLTNKKLAAATPLLFVAIIWLNVPYSYIYERKNWYYNLKETKLQLTGNYFYFADHGNLIHWKLLNGYDTSIHVINFDLKPYNGSYYPYYDSLRFHPGWFINNNQYTERSFTYISQIDSLGRVHFFDSTIRNGPVSAYYFSNLHQFNFLKEAVDHEKRRQCNCNEPEP